MKKSSLIRCLSSQLLLARCAYVDEADISDTVLCCDNS